MGQFFDEISSSLATWIEAQRMFWVATAPLGEDGMVNISPKGFQGTFHIVNSRKVWYEDLTGSGMETTAHLRENRRITILFNAYEGPPKIARLYGKGTVHEFGTPEYNELIPQEKRQPGSRAAIVIDVFKVGTNCGYAVPLFAFQGYRSQLHEWAIKKEIIDRAAAASAGTGGAPDGSRTSTQAHSDRGAGDFDAASLPEGGLKSFWQEKNLRSFNGLPAMLTAHASGVPFPDYNPATSLVQGRTTRIDDRLRVTVNRRALPMAPTEESPANGPISRDASSPPSLMPSSSTTATGPLGFIQSPHRPSWHSYFITNSPTSAYAKSSNEDFGRAVAFILGIIMTLTIQRIIPSLLTVLLY